MSNLVRPANLSLTEWQRMLRVQAATNPGLSVVYRKNPEHPGLFNVNSTDKQGRINGYNVVYQGLRSTWNRCECPDFKTSRLGTCKHIEAVKNYLLNHRASGYTLDPPGTSLMIDHSKLPLRLRLRIGTENREEITEIASKYFDSEGYAIHPDEDAAVIEFFRDMVERGLELHAEQDVYRVINERRSHKLLAEISRSRLTDELVQSLVKPKLYPYQIEGIKFAFTNGRSIIADEMGLGKTLQAIATAELLYHFKLATSVLIICPTSLKYQWQREIEKFTGRKALVIEGNTLKRREQYEATEPFYKIVSYHAVSNDIKSGYNLSVDLMVMDEVQRLKNWETQLARSARKIKSTFTVALSGTPLENKLEELYSIVELINQYTLSPFYEFRDRYITTDEAGMTIGYKNLHEITERLKNLLIRRRKADVALQIPPRQDRTIYVPMTKEQNDLHAGFADLMSRIVKKWRTYKFLSEQDRLRLLKLLSSMRMVANSTYILDLKTRFDTKVDEMLSLLDNILANPEEKVVVFSSWERMTSVIAEELKARGIGFSNLNGKVPSAKRKQVVDSFLDNPDCRVFLSTDAGATGLNLQAAATIINLDLPWNPAVLEQRIGRVFRLGQTRNVQVINFVSIGSIEEQIETKIGFKAALFAGILDNGEDTVLLPRKGNMDEIIEAVADMVEQPVENVATVEEPEPATTAPIGPDVIEDVDFEEEVADDDVPNQPSPTFEHGAKDSGAGAGTPKTVAPGKMGKQKSEELLRKGFDFFSGLASALQSPESTKELVDSIVETDPESGRTSLKIPVPSKEAVTSLLSSLSSLFSELGKK